MRALALAAMLLFPLAAQAQTIDITFNQQATDAGLDEAALESALSQQLGEELSLDGLYEEFVQSMVEASAISTKGLGVDYASNIDKFVFGGSLAAGTHQAGFTFNRGKDLLPRGGYAAHISLMAGINVGMGGEGKDRGFFDRIRLYANGMALRFPSEREFQGKMANAGGHLQIKLIEGPNAKVVEWGGLDLTSGFEYSSYTFALGEGDLPIAVPMGSGASMTWSASGRYDVKSEVMAVPVELSTNLRILVISAYLGGGYDYNLGTGSSNTSLSGPLEGKLPAPDGSTFDGPLGSAEIAAGATGEAVQNSMRLFFGAQANVLVLKVYGHLNVAPLNGALGGNLGLRVAL